MKTDLAAQVRGLDGGAKLVYGLLEQAGRPVTKAEMLHILRPDVTRITPEMSFYAAQKLRHSIEKEWAHTRRLVSAGIVALQRETQDRDILIEDVPIGAVSRYQIIGRATK